MQVITFTLRLFKKYFDTLRNERMRLSLLQALPFWIASILTGIVAVIYSKFFAWSEILSLRMLDIGGWLIFITAPTFFLLSALLVNKGDPYARGSGIPQVMASIELSGDHKKKVSRLLNLRVMFVKIGSSLLLVLGGGAIGREGPTIQIAGSIFQKVNQWTPKSWPKINQQNMIMTGAAAGLAAAFNTPLGGIVFAVEELTKTHISYFRTALFSAVIIAGLAAQGILGPYLYLGFPRVDNLSPYIFAVVLLVAIIGGLAGAAFSKVTLRLLQLKSTFIKPSKQIAWILGCAMIVACLAFFVNIQILGSGKELMKQLLFTDEKHLQWYVPFLRFSGTVLSFLSGGAGGIFAPSLSAGSSIGAVVAGWLHLTAGNANLLILAGMVSFLTGVTRTPFTAAILVLEMTDRHSIIFYLMLAALTANLVALIIDKRSFYDHLKKQYLREVIKEDQPPLELKEV